MPDRPLDHAPRSQILIAFAAVYVIWGSTYLAIRFAIETLPPFLMVGTRFFVAGAVMYAWLRARGAPAPKAVHWRSAAIIGILMPVLGTGVVVWAEERVPSGIAALLVSIMPLWMVLLQWLRPGGKRPSWWVIAGVVLGLAGLYMLVDPGGDGKKGNLLVEGILLLAALSWAIGSLYSKRAPHSSSKFIGTGMEMLVAGVVLITAGLATGEASHFAPGATSAKSWLALLYLITCGSIIAYTAYVWLLKTVNPTLVSTYAFVNPVVAVFLGWAFASEPLNARMIAAAAIIVVAVALITIGGKDG
ncbi:MAG: drug/metabolite exporter YedA [Gemmatimonadaceae bacterium]|nr:drug/metabolite exporter YedA [Gemmatimonadaceae bacterium]